MSDTENKKLKWSIGIIVAVITLVFGFLGALLQQSFFAGAYARTIDNNVNSISNIQTEFEAHKKYDDDTYLKKEVFKQFQEGRIETNRQLINMLNKIDDKVDKIIMKTGK